MPPAADPLRMFNQRVVRQKEYALELLRLTRFGGASTQAARDATIKYAREIEILGTVEKACSAAMPATDGAG